MQIQHKQCIQFKMLLWVSGGGWERVEKKSSSKWMNVRECHDFDNSDVATASKNKRERVEKMMWMFAMSHNNYPELFSTPMQCMNWNEKKKKKVEQHAKCIEY